MTQDLTGAHKVSLPHEEKPGDSKEFLQMGIGHAESHRSKATPKNQ